MVPSTNRSGHRPFKAEMPGSNPAGITIYRIGVTAARLTLTQEVVVQIPDPVPYTFLAQLAEQRSFKPQGAGSSPAGRTNTGECLSPVKRSGL